MFMECLEVDMAVDLSSLCMEADMEVAMEVELSRLCMEADMEVDMEVELSRLCMEVDMEVELLRLCLHTSLLYHLMLVWLELVA
jgi:hypothetical protein